MKIVVFTNDNFFSFTILKHFLDKHKNEVKLMVFSSSLIGTKDLFQTIKWLIKKTGYYHTFFKLSVYGVFKFLTILSGVFPVKNKYSSVLWAKKNNINFKISSNINSEDFILLLEKISPDLIISVSMNQIIGERILKIPTNGSINVHCSMLPKYAGISPYIWVLANNEKFTATTIHYMTEKVDEGDIILQTPISIKKNDTAFSLFYRCCIQSSKDLVEVVDRIKNGCINSCSQDLRKKTYYSWPNKNCIKKVKQNGYKLFRLKDFIYAIFKGEPFIK